MCTYVPLRCFPVCQKKEKKMTETHDWPMFHYRPMGDVTHSLADGGEVTFSGLRKFLGPWTMTEKRLGGLWLIGQDT